MMFISVDSIEQGDFHGRDAFSRDSPCSCQNKFILYVKREAKTKKKL